MKKLLIDKKGVMYWASLTDIRDLWAGIRKPSTVLPSLEKTRLEDVTVEEFGSRVYVEFICNRAKNERVYNRAKMESGGRTVKAYGYLQRLYGFRTDVAAWIDGHMYIIPMEDAIEYTLGLINRAGLVNRMEARGSARHNFDHLGITRYLIVV
ncbi:hypothetical protein BD26P3_00045 [Phocaeicola phage BD26P3]|nr:hypothetical protein BD26P1_00040 [Phocaeicola phage BD26P1]WAX06072.1 hypothetical protein BD26P2_00025 [Phocaeicola phage BD26P2]WAX06141.1 hypothetical protein BD26P3_00045 [Phocaeicola phage BD26P3]WAX06169.1 hypothetical protein BD26P4_00025 [Phocaeicola phage BD26P4]WAX06239.1 hypothetical protein BD26P5_00046 [Phocaeicola phage BD26P5]